MHEGILEKEKTHFYKVDLLKVPHTRDTGVRCNVSHAMCQVSHVMCHMSHLTPYVSCAACHVSHVTCHMLLTPTATATDPPPDNYPTMHSKDKQINYYMQGNFRPFMSKVLRSMSFHYFSLRIFFVIDHLDLGPL